MNTPPPVFVPKLVPSALVASQLLRAIVGGDPCRVLEAQEVEIGKACASFIADCHGTSWAEAWNALGHVPDAMLPLLRTAEGWGTLSDHVAATSGGPRPTIH